MKFKSGSSELTVTVDCVGGKPHLVTSTDDHGGGGAVVAAMTTAAGATMGVGPAGLAVAGRAAVVAAEVAAAGSSQLRVLLGLPGVPATARPAMTSTG